MQNHKAAITIDQLVVNWHITQACNYRCRYCYSSWDEKRHTCEIFRKKKSTTQLLKELHQFLKPDNSENPIHSILNWENVRLSLAGGETLLHPMRTTQIAQEAKDLGFDISLITNGSLLDFQQFPDLAESISMLGISIDSAIPATNCQTGRADYSGKILDLEKLITTIEFAKELYPGLRVKINTVVNELNFREDLTRTIERIQPDKWKVLKALPVITSDLTISEDQFEEFTNRHKHMAGILSVENNHDMTESYIMVDPAGCFFQNQTNSAATNPYIHSQSIIKIGAKEAFKQIQFNAEKFASRYGVIPKGEML